MQVENQTRDLADQVLTLVDDVLGANPWVRFGVSAAVGLAAGLAGGRLMRTGIRLAIGIGARKAARYAFDVAFDAGHRDALRAGSRIAVPRPATEHSY